MAKQPKKKPKVRQDFAENAFRVVQEATGQAPKTPDPDAGKDPAAVERGKKGGAKGGRVRAEKLSKAERSTIARNAARARWARPEG
jgi:hypothetical protein